MLSHQFSQDGNSITGGIGHTGTGFYGSNLHVGGNLIINAGAAFNSATGFKHSIDLTRNVRLLDDFIEVLQRTVGGSSDYRRLIDELYRLRKAVVAISKLGFSELQCQRSLAVTQAVKKLQDCIDVFLRLTNKCESRPWTSDVDWRDDLWEIQWAQFEKDEVAKFRAELEGHTSAIETLLITLQLSTGQPRSRERIDHDHDGQSTFQHGTPTRTEECSAENMALLRGLTQQQAEWIQSLIQTVQHQQVMLQQLQKLPPQVELRKPVILEDACGRVAPFHLDFINSREAFVAVLKVRFKDIGLQKIENGEFCLEERGMKREIDLSRPWDTVLLPGQKVDMSMVFQRRYTADAKCHGCGAFGQVSGNNFECPNCGLNCTRRIQDTEETPAEGPASRETGRSLGSPSVLGKRKLSSLAEPCIQDFRRVQVIELRRQLNANIPITPEAENEELLTINCGCGFQFDLEGDLVFDERCKTWQHIKCYYPTMDVPDEHHCVDCEPRPFDRQDAIDRKKRRRERKIPLRAELTLGDRTSMLANTDWDRKTIISQLDKAFNVPYKDQGVTPYPSKTPSSMSIPNLRGQELPPLLPLPRNISSSDEYPLPHWSLIGTYHY
ncbi:MAG: hypothetical protein M1812_007445 [Candelaria pacifica]|nr:MAG: hypothetical protein M1812_007445 [Candelaria pacifica]